MRPVERSMCMTIKWERLTPTSDEVSFRMLAEEGAFSLHQHVRVEGDVYQIVECAIESRVLFDGTGIWFVRAEHRSDR